MQHSDFEIPTEGTESGIPQSASDELASQIASALEQGDHQTAGNLLRDITDRFGDDNRFLRLAAKQRRQAERFTRVFSLLKETSVAIEGDEFVRAVGAFREAANLSQGFADLEQATFQAALAEARQLGDRNWRIARTLLDEASHLNPQWLVPDSLWQQVHEAEREETVSNVLADTALAKPAELERARERLQRTLNQYPGDSGIQSRLKSIESTIEDKRKWDDRQKCLKKLTDLRAALQREVDPAQVGQYIPQSEALAAPYRADLEFSSVVEDINHQITSSQKALAALKVDRIDECLEECAWVLSRMRHHQLFLRLKQQAEARELSLVDEYSDSVSRIKDLLAAGQLAEAETLCSAASAKLPQFSDLKELAREIDLRKSQQDHHLQHNVDSARRLVERGERSLLDDQFRAAEQSFRNALKLLPEDKKLPGHIIGMLHGYARAIARENAESAEEALKIAERLVPGKPIPADLAEALREKRQQAKEESVRWAALNKINDLNAQVESARKREEIVALREEVQRNNFASVNHADVKESAAALFSKINGKLTAFDQRQARWPALLKAIPIAAAVILAVGVAYWLNNRPLVVAPSKPASPAALESAAVTKPVPAPPPATGTLLIRSDVPGAQVFINGKEYTVSSKPLKVELSADSYQVTGSRSGFKDFGPVTVAVAKSAQTVLDVKLAPKPANLEIQGAEPDTRIKVDGALMAKATTLHQILTKQLPAGNHFIELSRSGYLPKTITRTLAPGEVLALSSSDLKLQSADARTLASAQRSMNSVAKADELQWKTLDKSNPELIRGFISQYPSSPLAAQAKKDMEGLLWAREMNAEERDWSSADHSSKVSLQDFLKKHPDGRHSSSATNALADLDRKAETQSAEDAGWKKVNQHDEKSLQSYLRDSPAGSYRGQAEVALANLRLAQSSKNETTAVLTVISRFATAWSSKDLDSILAIQKNLNKRTVKAELSHVKELTMRISPASPPQIEGSQAVVLCRREASQIFSDGTRKQIPEAIVSYVLAKHDGNWTIEGTR